MDVVTRLREGELRPLRLQADDGLHASAFKSLYERGEGQELVRQQYTGRYPFELLENANDAARDAGERGRAHFLLTESALIVADNGFGFGDEQVDAICSLRRSSKGPGKAVGHKGLGVKSVGEITDHPQITSARASFQFSSHRVRAEASAILGPLPDGQKLPVYAFPFPIDPADFGPDAEQVAELRRSGFTTVIRLPLNEGVDRETVEKHLLHEVPDVDEIGVPEFLSLLPAPTRNTANDYYLFLATWREKAGTTLVTELKKTASVLGVNGHLFTPDADTIFFPRERGDVALP